MIKPVVCISISAASLFPSPSGVAPHVSDRMNGYGQVVYSNVLVV
jgi:hypothetical protein